MPFNYVPLIIRLHLIDVNSFKETLTDISAGVGEEALSVRQLGRNKYKQHRGNKSSSVLNKILHLSHFGQNCNSCSLNEPRIGDRNLNRYSVHSRGVKEESVKQSFLCLTEKKNE